MYSPEELEKSKQAGRITAEVLEAARGLVKPGAKLLDIAERIEAMMREKGAEPAFPANLSLNSTAAHYTPPKNDATIVQENDIIKIDIGAHIDGYAGDTAITICFNKDYGKMAEASQRALEEAIKDERSCVVQEYAEVKEEKFPILNEDGTVTMEKNYEISGFASSESGLALMARCSLDPVVNISRRGGIIPVVLLG